MTGVEKLGVLSGTELFLFVRLLWNQIVKGNKTSLSAATYL